MTFPENSFTSCQKEVMAPFFSFWNSLFLSAFHFSLLHHVPFQELKSFALFAVEKQHSTLVYMLKQSAFVR